MSVHFEHHPSARPAVLAALAADLILGLLLLIRP